MTRSSTQGSQLALVVALLGAACGVEEPPKTTLPDGGFAVDTDRDWACDDTEIAFQTDPNDADSDGDGLPDGAELRYGLDPRVETDPGATRIIFLQSEPGASTEIDVHELVDGAGEAFSGELDPWQALDLSWPIVEQYFASAIAVSAEPPDHVFGFPDNGDRIESVVGETRLGFRLRFVFGDDQPRDCAQVVPFVYAIKRQDGVRFGNRIYLLMSGPDRLEPNWCITNTCF